MTVGTLSPDEKNLYTIVFAIRQLQEGRSNATVREVLSAARTYYVRADGADTNDGQADSASRAFLTLQKAIDAALKLDLNGFAVTIQVRSGTFAGFTLSVPFVGGLVTIAGDPATPANVIINKDTNSAFNQNSLQQFQSGSTGATSGTSSGATNPWAPAQPYLSGILAQLQGQLPATSLTPTESSALTGLADSAGYMKQFLPGATSLATDLLAGGTPIAAARRRAPTTPTKPR
jgi:hypothetical protein